MHEMSLVEGITKVIAEKAAENRINKITKVKLVIGKLTNALPDALNLAFEVIRNEESLYDAEAQLVIEERKTTGKCNECRKEFSIEDNYSFICPDCDSLLVTIVSGRELYVDYFEGE